MHKTERPHHSICLGARATRTTPHRGRCPSPTQARDHTCPSDRTLQSSLLQTSRQPTRPSGAGASPRCLEGGPRPGPQDSELQVPRTQLFLSGRTTPSLGDRGAGLSAGGAKRPAPCPGSALGQRGGTPDRAGQRLSAAPGWLSLAGCAFIRRGRPGPGACVPSAGPRSGPQAAGSGQPRPGAGVRAGLRGPLSSEQGHSRACGRWLLSPWLPAWAGPPPQGLRGDVGPHCRSQILSLNQSL